MWELPRKCLERIQESKHARTHRQVPTPPLASQHPPSLTLAPVLLKERPQFASSIHPLSLSRRRSISIRHGREQQHHGGAQLRGPSVLGAGDRRRHLAGLQAGERVRPPRPVARPHPRRPPPARLPRRLRRRLLEQSGPARRLPLLHGCAHRPPPRPPRLRLLRHPRRRLLPRPRPRLPRVPPRRLLPLASPLRRRSLGSDPRLPPLLRRLPEARRESALPHRRPVLRHRSLPSPVGMLQAADDVRVRVRKPDDVDQPEQPGGGRGLRCVEQRPEPALLRLRLLQGGAAGEPPRGVAEGQRRPHRRRRRARLDLRHRLLRLQERPNRGPLPPVQASLRLALSSSSASCPLCTPPSASPFSVNDCNRIICKVMLICARSLYLVFVAGSG